MKLVQGVCVFIVILFLFGPSLTVVPFLFNLDFENQPKISSIDDTPPVITNQPSNMTYEQGTTGHVMNWTVRDSEDNEGSYLIYCQGGLLVSGLWRYDEIVEYNVDGYEIGSYEFVFTAKDWSNNEVNSTCYLNVIEYSGTNPSITITATTTTSGFSFETEDIPNLLTMELAIVLGLLLSVIVLCIGTIFHRKR